MTNLPCECQELKPKGETNSSFLVLHPLSGVHTVKTVGSHLKRVTTKCKSIRRETTLPGGIRGWIEISTIVSCLENASKHRSPILLSANRDLILDTPHHSQNRQILKTLQ